MGGTIPSDSAPPAHSRTLFIAVAATLGLIFLLMLLVAWRRAGWLDEYWTVWHTDPANPLRVAYWQRWLHDTQHPPNFYAFTWLLAPLTGPTLAARRLVGNGLGLLILVLPTVIVCRRRGTVQPQPLLFALMMASGPYSLLYFGEHRSYFLALTATSCLVATLRRLHRDSAAGLPIARGPTIWLVLIALVATNLHYTFSLCGLILLGCESLWQWFRGRRPMAVLATVAALIALVPLTINLLLALSLQRPVAVVNESLLLGWATLGFMLVIGGLANVVLLREAAIAYFHPDRNVPGPYKTDGSASFFLVLGAALITLTILFLIMHALSRNLYPRLLLGLIPIVTSAICELAARRPLSRAITAAACANALLVAAAASVYGLRNPRWEYEVPAIQAAIRACPSTQLLAVSPVHLLPPDDPAWHMTGQAQAMALGYHMIARKYGFPVHVVPEDGPPPPLDARCPTLVWLEHNFVRPDLTIDQLIAVAGVKKPASATATWQRDRSHALATISAGPPSPLR